MIQITELHTYPVKSLQGISLKQATLGIRGLEWDRNWMVTDINGEFITQRSTPKMATISVSLTDDSLVLEHPSASPLSIPLNKGNRDLKEVSVWDDHCSAFDEGDEASQWLTKILGMANNAPLRLVRFPQEEIRQVNPKYLHGEQSHTAFADGFPFLITSEESLELLNKNLVKNMASELSMDRFRPNIVIRGVLPFEEDSFDTLTSSEDLYQLGVRKPCERCPVTTTDQRTGQRANPKEPLRTLVQMNTHLGVRAAYFGQNATLLNGDAKVISVGDYLISKKKKL